jgi:hypothetical protein
VSVPIRPMLLLLVLVATPHVFSVLWGVASLIFGNNRAAKFVKGTDHV